VEQTERFGHKRIGWEIAVFKPEQIEPFRGHVSADLSPSQIGLPGRKLSAVEIALDGTRVPGVPEDE
jgi:hypothetical protein